ncbi:MAG: flagellar filament capping protein FliD [Alphaproteobacteria bacterium]|nr:flagellar filament capping protein FliD [Alphaproteobacteria bacterium]
MVSSVSSGITSALGMGYGIDSSSIVTGLVSAVRAPKNAALTSKESLASAQVSALANASSALDNFSTALTTLLDSSDYSGQPASSNSSIANVSLTQPGALTGLPIELEVKQLATSQVLKSATLADSSTAVGLGTLTLSTSTGSYNIVIDSSNNTLDGLAAAINDAGAGVTASIITDSSGSRLVLKGGVGENEAFTLADGGDADTDLLRFTWDGAAGGMTQTRPAQNAVIVLDGVETSYSSNSITGAIPNVTIDLVKATPGTTITISEEQPTTTIRDLVTEFAAAYNTLWNALSALTVAGTDGAKGGILASDSSVRQMKDMLSKLTSTSLVASGDYRSLAQIGVRTNKDGTLEVNKDALDAALAANPAAVTAMINPPVKDASNPGLSGALEAIKDKLQDKDTGALVKGEERYKAAQKKLVDEREKFETYMDGYEERLNSTFSAMDTRLASLKATQSYLEQQIEIWNNSKN